MKPHIVNAASTREQVEAGLREELPDATPYDLQEIIDAHLVSLPCSGCRSELLLDRQRVADLKRRSIQEHRRVLCYCPDCLDTFKSFYSKAHAQLN